MSMLTDRGDVCKYRYAGRAQETMKSLTADALKAAQERGRERRRQNMKARAAHATQVRVARAKPKPQKPTIWRTCGHPRTPQNTYTTKTKGWECCYRCKRRRWLEYEARKDARDSKPLLEVLWPRPSA